MKVAMQLQGWAVHKFVNARPPLTAELDVYRENPKEAKHCSVRREIGLGTYCLNQYFNQVSTRHMY